MKLHNKHNQSGFYKKDKSTRSIYSTYKQHIAAEVNLQKQQTVIIYQKVHQIPFPNHGQIIQERPLWQKLKV